MTTTNTYGRQVVVPLTNKSGGAVIAGDVVVVGTANNDAFTTTSSAGFTGTVGVAQETIADNATGRVLISGYAALVNTTASVTRQNFATTSTTVKKAVDAGASRTVGTFCQFLTGGTTPDAIVYPADLGTTATTVAAHGARVHRASTDYSVGNNVYTAVSFDAEDTDTDTIHDNSTNPTRLTIPSISGVTTGLWLVVFSGYTDQTVADIQFRVGANANPASGTAIGFMRSNVTSPGGSPSLSALYVFTAADYVEAFVRTPGGTGKAIHDAGNSPLFSVAFLGKVT